MSQAMRAEYRNQASKWYNDQLAGLERQFQRPGISRNMTRAEVTALNHRAADIAAGQGNRFRPLDVNLTWQRSADMARAMRTVRRAQIRERQANLRDSRRRGLSPGQAQARLTRLQNRQAQGSTTVTWRERGISRRTRMTSQQLSKLTPETRQGLARAERGLRASPRKTETVQGGVVNQRYRPASARTVRNLERVNTRESQRATAREARRISRVSQRNSVQRSRREAAYQRTINANRARRDQASRIEGSVNTPQRQAALERTNVNTITQQATALNARRLARTRAGQRPIGRARPGDRAFQDGRFVETASFRSQPRQNSTVRRIQAQTRRAERRQANTLNGEYRPPTPPSRMSSIDRRARQLASQMPSRFRAFGNRTRADRQATARYRALTRQTARSRMSTRERNYFRTYGYRAADGSRKFGRPPAAILLRYRQTQRALNSQLHRTRVSTSWYNRRGARRGAQKRALNQQTLQRFRDEGYRIVDPKEKERRRRQRKG